MNDHMDEMI
ncbi:Protein of unknown function [Lactobacillus helveticus CIRM-BIA 101]|uniref:Uncharacterized protein n=3 Tax=Lactobacillus helveticus TaxID=1587 RepID=U4QK07_LACHE|nr:Protein of unknown function [Lactobacillus helveticus CIRM-BIA 953]CDI58099.1 Protein of unknown function [Lactobacillus helveticus CIRM-BIA 951]CDI59597.1 Protein of unknown function [Lactobacillus helveticus CIRM-BIA 104]CDI62061.1 Protein of unknown function [Lactobacillus helveticus CIRM-BIA 103]CDI65836.1 Protein of unknown function [Lactobacillus helveticus CIRM-BIA 101]